MFVRDSQVMFVCDSSPIPLQPTTIRFCSDLFLKSSNIILCESDLSFTPLVGDLQGTSTLKSKLYSTQMQVKKKQLLTFGSYKPFFIQVQTFFSYSLGIPNLPISMGFLSPQ